MASTFKPFLETDIATTRDELYEVIPLTGSIMSGSVYNDENIKNYSHGMWQSVYDYPYLSSSANQIFDITAVYSPQSSLSSSANTQNEKKINLYNSLAQVHMGHDVSGSILEFDQDGNIAGGGNKLRECAALVFTRLLMKDEIKKDSFRITLYTASVGAPGDASGPLIVGDYGAASSYKTNSPVGDYGILYTSSATPVSDSGVGLVFYKTGLVLITGSVFEPANDLLGFYDLGGASGSFEGILSGSTIQSFSDGLRNRIVNIEFNNTTNINSTIYFCRMNNGEFNYSSNPTYLSSSRIVTKNKATDLPVTYITTIGLYNSANELMAVGKLSTPIKKRADNELTVRMRLDY